jgi:hypothetical protein
MLTISGGSSTRFCDGIARRDFLRIGGLAMGGMSLPQLMAAQSKDAATAAGVLPGGAKSVIMIFLPAAPRIRTCLT